MIRYMAFLVCAVLVTVRAEEDPNGAEIPPILHPAMQAMMSRYQDDYRLARDQAEIHGRAQTYMETAPASPMPGGDFAALANYRVRTVKTKTPPGQKENTGGPPMVAFGEPKVICELAAQAIEQMSVRLAQQIDAQERKHLNPEWVVHERLAKRSQDVSMSIGTRHGWAAPAQAEASDVVGIGLAALISEECRRNFQNGRPYALGYGQMQDALNARIKAHHATSGAFNALFYHCYVWGPFYLERMRDAQDAAAANRPVDNAAWERRYQECQRTVDAYNLEIDQDDKNPPEVMKGTWDPGWIEHARSMIARLKDVKEAGKHTNLAAARVTVFRLIDMHKTMHDGDIQKNVCTQASLIINGVEKDITDTDITERSRIQDPEADVPPGGTRPTNIAITDGTPIPLGTGTETAINDTVALLVGRTDSNGTTTTGLLDRKRWQPIYPTAWPVREVGNPNSPGAANPADLMRAKDALAWAAHLIHSRVESNQRYGCVDVQYGVYLRDVVALRHLIGNPIFWNQPSGLAQYAQTLEYDRLYDRLHRQEVVSAQKQLVLELQAHARLLRRFESDPRTAVPGHTGSGAHVSECVRAVALLKAALGIMRKPPTWYRSAIGIAGDIASAPVCAKRFGHLFQCADMLGIPFTRDRYQ